MVRFRRVFFACRLRLVCFGPREFQNFPWQNLRVPALNPLWRVKSIPLIPYDFPYGFRLIIQL